jgi:hypothetical protein
MGAAVVTGRKASLLAAMLVLCGHQSARGQSAGLSGEALLKIEFIERFTRFIDWPPGVLDSQPRFVVCIAGNGPIAEYLPRQSAGDKFKGKSPEFRRVHVGDSLNGCHLLFIAPSEATHLPALLTGISRRPILTVADMAGAGERGVLVNFYREGEHVLFEINLAAADKSGLTFSARLLKLARLVGPEDKRMLGGKNGDLK